MALRALAGRISKVTRPALVKRGAAFATLIAEWSNAVGPALAEQSLPERLTRPPDKSPDTGGILTVRVASGGTGMEFQHLHAQIVERINGYLGFRAVARLVLRQAPLPDAAQPPTPRVSRPVAPATRARVATAVAAVEDAELKAALERLGQALASHEE